MKKGWKWFWGVLGALVLVVMVLAAIGYREARSRGFFREPVFETERPALPELQRPAVLVFSKTNAFVHREAIPAAKHLLQQLGAEQGWSVYLSDSGAAFNADDLARFDVIVWNNVTGDVLLPEQREAMRVWLEQGGGYVGLHAAGDNSHEPWPWYVEHVIRARWTGHPLSPQFQQAAVLVEQPADPIVADLPPSWNRTDEWYSFAQSPRAPDLRVLAALDESSYVPEMWGGTSIRMGSDHPIIWKHCVGRGRIFYSALGHTAASYAEPEYREVLRRAIAWAGRIGGGTTAGTLACESG